MMRWIFSCALIGYVPPCESSEIRHLSRRRSPFFNTLHSPIDKPVLLYYDIDVELNV